MITEKNASQPRSRFSPSSTRAATSLVAEVMDRAMSVSSECRRGFWLPRRRVLSRWMGSMASSLMTSSSMSTPVTAFSAFMSSELAAPRREEVLPVTTEPSGITMAPAGAPVVCSFSRAAERAGEKSLSTPAFFMMPFRRSTCSWPEPVRLTCSAAVK